MIAPPKADLVSKSRIADTTLGADAAVHVSKPGRSAIFAIALIMFKMSEEIENPSLTVPRSIITSILLNGCLGFGILMATLFGIGDLNNVLKSPTNFPFVEIFLQATRSIPGTTAMTSIVITLAVSSTIGCVATSSRMTWSFARDRGLPFSKILSKVGSTPLVKHRNMYTDEHRYLGGAS